MFDTRLLDITSLPECSEIEIIVECLDPDRCEDDDTESDCESFFDDTHHIEGYDSHEYHHHEPETSRFGIASFFSFLPDFLSRFSDSSHR